MHPLSVVCVNIFGKQTVGVNWGDFIKFVRAAIIQRKRRKMLAVFTIGIETHEMYDASKVLNLKYDFM